MLNDFIVDSCAKHGLPHRPKPLPPTYHHHRRTLNTPPPTWASPCAGGFMVQDGIVVIMRNAVIPDGVVI
jgi:hypothetical protein